MKLNLLRKVGPVSDIVLLPVRVISTMEDYDGEAALRDAGVFFHGPLADQSHLRFADLPPGWKVVNVNDSNWLMTNLLDNKNRVRATMRHMYYSSGMVSDRQVGGRATMKVACPFIISFRGEREGELVARIRIRHGSEIEAMPAVPIHKPGPVGKVKAELRVFMRQYLDKMMPDWKTNSKYWDHKKVE